jgi:hypothetical protein
VRLCIILHVRVHRFSHKLKKLDQAKGPAENAKGDSRVTNSRCFCNRDKTELLFYSSLHLILAGNVTL